MTLPAWLTRDNRACLDALAPVAARSLDERPVFIFSAGWRSGSTLLQRLVCSDPRIIVWGEPFEDRMLVPAMQTMLLSCGHHDPHEKYSIQKLHGELTSEWIANLNPGYQNLFEAQHAFYESLLAQPARQRGYSRWGTKAVRLSGLHAMYLKKLYPAAKIIFLVRNPRAAWSSYRGAHWYWQYPDLRMDSAAKFFRNWQFLARSFLDTQTSLGALLIRYEDLVTDAGVIDRIAGHIDAELDHGVINLKVGSSKDKGLRGKKPGWDGWLAHRRADKALLGRFDY